MQITLLPCRFSRPRLTECPLQVAPIACATLSFLLHLQHCCSQLQWETLLVVGISIVQ